MRAFQSIVVSSRPEGQGSHIPRSGNPGATPTFRCIFLIIELEISIVVVLQEIFSSGNLG